MKKKSFESIVDEIVSVNYTENYKEKYKKQIDKKEIYKLKYYFNKNGKVATEL